MPCECAVPVASQFIDDETLFGSFTIVRYRPRVIVCLRSRLQENRGTGVTYFDRELETAAALEALGQHDARTGGIDFEQWNHPDDEPDWNALEAQLRALAISAPQEHWDRVFAPAVEEGGHPHHSRIGELADDVFGAQNVTHYLTYVNGRGRSEGRLVEWENSWIELKLRALACYRSQIELHSTGHHFMQALHEWYE